MSKDNVSIVKQLDERISLNEQKYAVVEIGSKQVNQYNRTATNASNSNITFDNVAPGSLDFVIPREMFVEAKFDGLKLNVPPGEAADLAIGTGLIINVTVAPNAVDGYNAQVSLISEYVADFCPRRFPLHNATSSLEVKLNGQIFTEQINRYLQPLMLYDNPKRGEKGSYSMTPNMPDNAKYRFFDRDSDNVSNAISPFVGYGFNSSQDSRQSYWYTRNEIGGMTNWWDTVLDRDAFIALFAGIANGALLTRTSPFTGIKTTFQRLTADTVRLISIEFPPLSVVEPVMIPILATDRENYSMGLTGISDLRIVFQFDSGKLGDRLISRLRLNYRANITNAVVDLLNNTPLSIGNIAANSQKLYYDVLTPKLTTKIPDSNVYDDLRVDIKNQTLSGQLTNINTKLTVRSNSFTVNSIPARMYVWCAKRKELQTSVDSDTFLNIENFSLNFNNSGPQFQMASPAQLYRMCKHNGLQSSYLDFTVFQGAVICIDFGKDVSLDEISYPGLLGNFNYDVQIEIADKTHDYTTGAINLGEYELNILTVLKGYCVIENSTCTRVGGVPQVDPATLEIGNIDALIKHSYTDRNMYGGGSVVESLKSLVQKGARGAKRALEWAEENPEFVKNVASKGFKIAKWMLPLLAGAGISESEAKEILQEHGYDAGMARIIKKGGGVVGGGKLVSKKRLKNEMKLY